MRVKFFVKGDNLWKKENVRCVGNLNRLIASGS